MTTTDPATDAPPSKALRAVRIDYLTLSMERRHLDAVLGWAGSRFGVPKSGRGMFTLRASKRYTDGRCVVAFDPPSETARDYLVLSITGSGCAQLGDEELILSVEDMQKQTEAKVTRLDIAVDHFESSFPISIFDLRHICKHTNELCGARVGRYTDSFTAGTGANRGETLDIGRRGKDGSGRSVCVYDKGLESGTESEAGRWVRWEARFAADCAEKALAAYSQASTSVEKMNIAYDAVEFREDTSAKYIYDRPLSPWWIEVKQGVDESNIIRRTRKDSSAAKCLMWLDNAVGPMLHHIKKETGLEWDDLLSLIGIGQGERYKPKEHVIKLIEEMQNGVTDDDGVEQPSVYSMLFERTAQGV